MRAAAPDCCLPSVPVVLNLPCLACSLPACLLFACLPALACLLACLPARPPWSSCLPAVTTEEAAALGGVPVPPSPSLECGRALWCDFFSVAPATTTAPSTSLDFIAP